MALTHCFAEILHEAEYLWDRPMHSDTTSESGLSSASSGIASVRSYRSNGVEINTPSGRRILGNPSGPTIITVSGAMATNYPYDSMMYNSMEEPMDGVLGVAGGPVGHTGPRSAALMVNTFDEAVDLEPIDFEHFVDEPDLNRTQSERMFQVTFGSSPPTRGR